MKGDYLICLEIDNTLLDRNYRTTSPTINSVINQLSAEGHIFILNSNRALEDLLAIAKIFEITGPFIGENGTFIYYQDLGKTETLIDDAVLAQIEQIKNAIPGLINSYFPEAMFQVGDTTDINKNLDVQEIPRDKKLLFFMNEFRKYTISIHVKKIENGVLSKDITTAGKLCGIIAEYIEKNTMSLRASYTESYANVLVCPTTTDKTRAYNYLVQKFPKHLRIFIADDAEDKPVTGGDYLFVVNNATQEAKNMANYVSLENMTKGVEDILLKMDRLI